MKVRYSQTQRNAQCELWNHRGAGFCSVRSCRQWEEADICEYPCIPSAYCLYVGFLLMMRVLWSNNVTNSETWWGINGRNSLSDLNPSGILLLDFCANQVSTMFKHKRVGHQEILDRRPMIDFRIASSDQWPYVLNMWWLAGSDGRRGCLQVWCCWLQLRI